MMIDKISKLANNFLHTKPKNKDGFYNKQFTFAKYNNTLKTIFESNDDKLFEKVILANQNEMKIYIKKYKKYLKKNHLDFVSITKLSKNNNDNEILKKLLSLHNVYNNFSKNWNYKIINTLNIQTCLYCNREGILTFTNQDKSIQTTAEIDHFYPRSLYPFLSISFFNLIPSCKTCNSKFKGDLDTSILDKEILYPYKDDLNKKAKFTHFFNNPTKDTNHYSIFSKERISLKLQAIKDDDLKTSNTISTFRLNYLYDEHKDIVLELIQKAEIYNDSYVNELYNNYEGTLFKNREDLLRLITCGYVNDEDLNKRPLSKLTKDISEELGLI